MNNNRSVLDLNQVRAERCMKEVDALLSQYGCIMLPQTIITGGRVESMVVILPKPTISSDKGGPNG